MNIKLLLPVLSLSLLSLINCTSNPQSATNTVSIVGEMKNVMWKGELGGNIDLDTITHKTNLYGLGPVEYLAGEILITGGKSYKSTVVGDTAMKVEETFDLKAPFFGYANIAGWDEHTLPSRVQNHQQLEHYLDSVTQSSERPFMFKLLGTPEQATIHIVNLPAGSTVSSPEEAHIGQINYQLKNEASEIIGFFSTEHKAIFTHHDTYLHMHLITANRQKMGHVDEVVFGKGPMKLYLPTKD